MRKRVSKFSVVALLLVMISSCYKTSEGLGGAGITVVQFTQAVTINSYLTVAGKQTFSIVEIRRDVPSEAVLNSTQTVVIKLDPTVVTNYNTANSANYTMLSPSVYTFDASNPADASGNITLTFAAGEFAKSIKINMDLTALPAGQNALGFTVTTATGATIGGTKSAFVSIGAKNAYEATYTVTGYFFHPSSARAISVAKSITTLGVTTCKVPHSDLFTSNYYFQMDVSGTNTLINWVSLGSCPAAPAAGFMTSDNPGNVDYSASGAPTMPGTDPYTSSKYNNTYNPTTKVFMMHYGYGSGSTAPTGWTRQVYEQWVRQ